MAKKTTKTKKAKPKRLSDFCNECQALSLLKRIARDGDLLFGMAAARKFLNEKLGPDKNRDQPEGVEDHPGMRRFEYVAYTHWREPQWMENTGSVDFWSNECGGRCPTGKEFKVIAVIWAENWLDLWNYLKPREDEEGQDEKS